MMSSLGWAFTRYPVLLKNYRLGASALKLPAAGIAAGVTYGFFWATRVYRRERIQPPSTAIELPVM